MTLSEWGPIGLCIAVLCLTLSVFGSFALRYKGRVDQQLVVSAVWAGLLFIGMVQDGAFWGVAKPLLALLMVRYVRFFVQQTRPPTINEPETDYGHICVMGLFSVAFLVGVIATFTDIRPSYEALFTGVLVAYGVTVLIDSYKRYGSTFPMIGPGIYGFGIALPQLFVALNVVEPFAPETRVFHLVSYLCVTAGLIFMRVDEVLQSRETLLRAESSLAREKVRVEDVQMAVTLSRVLGNAVHSLGTPAVILGGLRDSISRRGLASVENRIEESLSEALTKISESKQRIAEVIDFVQLGDEESSEVKQVLTDVIKLFEHSLSGVTVHINSKTSVQVMALKSILLHLFISQITMHTFSLRKLGIHNKAELYIVASVHDGTLDIRVSEGVSTYMGGDSLDGEQVRLCETMEALLGPINGKLSVRCSQLGGLESVISMELR